MKTWKVGLVVGLFLLVFVAVSCDPTNWTPSLQPLAGGETIHLDWVAVNPPPGVSGPCYAYFHSIIQDASDLGFGYSGVWCNQN